MFDFTKNIYLWTHQGLGDAIICNGLVRNIYKKCSGKLIFFAKPQFYESVSFMFRDLKNLEVLSKDGPEVLNLLKNIPQSQQLHIGHQYLKQFLEQGISFDEAFYKQIGLNFHRAWTDFYIQRKEEQESTFFKQFNLPKEYIFLHEDTTRDLIIERNCILDKTLYIFEPKNNYTKNIFDYIKILEKATEIHCIDSSFKQLADRVSFDTKNRFIHHTLKNNITKDYTKSQSKLNWIQV